MKLQHLELFYSPLCPSCPEAKRIVREVAEEEGIALEEINIISEDGERKASEYGIKTVPYLVIDKVHHISGILRKETILEFISFPLQTPHSVHLF